MRKLSVRLTRLAPGDSVLVGTLGEQAHRTYFEYAREFLESGLELSPFKLPLGPGLFEHTDLGFGPLPGLFDDSLPDGWGLLLMDRHFQRRGIEPATLSSLDRLAYVGTSTMGALTYHPPTGRDSDAQLLDLYVLGRNAERVLAGEAEEVLPALERAGGSPAGARPKVLVGLRGDEVLSGEGDLPEGFEHWLVKFSARGDSALAGPVEYAYALMAAEAGLDLPQVRLFEVRKGRGVRRFFAVRRFDRGPSNERIHVHTFANLIHANFRIPSTDYADLLKVTRILTRNQQDVLRAFRRMVFNVASHNRDDHAKNFAFTMGRDGKWTLSPAYDVTFAAGPGGEHTMTVLGEGRRPVRAHCLELAERAGVRPREASAIVESVNAAVSRWTQFAERAGCPREVRSRIAAAIIRL